MDRAYCVASALFLTMVAPLASATDLGPDDRRVATRLLGQIAIQSCIRTVQANRAAIEREKKIEKVSGSLNDDVLQKAGAAIVDCEAESEDAYQLYRDAGGKQSLETVSRPRTIVLNKDELELLWSLDGRGLGGLAVALPLVGAIANGTVTQAEQPPDGGEAIALLPEQVSLRAALLRARDAQSRGREDAERATLERVLKEAEWEKVLVRHIQKAWNPPFNTPESFECTLRVQLLPDGTVTDVKTIKTCGNPPLDQSVEKAVFAGSPVPKPAEMSTFDRDVVIHFQPR